MEMVLFEEDWDKYPHYVVDLACPNPYLLRFCSTLKTMGVKNHHWPLQLHDRDLLGINPREPNLPEDIRKKISAECYSNFFYALRELLVIPGSSQGTPIWFEANRANMFLFWTFLCGVSPYLTLIRQGGKSYAMDVIKIWCYELRLAGCNGSIITTSEALRASNMERVRKIGNELPGWLRGRGLKDAANSEIYKVPMLQNFIRAWIASSSIENADKICRGQTDTTQNWDEIAYLNNFSISLPAASAAGARARWDAELRGDPYGSVFGTTAGRRDTRDGAYAYKMMMDSASWSEAFMDLQNREKLHEAVSAGSRQKDLVVFGSFLHNQIGRSDEWLQTTMRQSKSFGEDAEKDFGNKWLSGTLKSPFTSVVADRISNSEVKEYHTSFSPGNFAIRHYTGPTMHTVHHRNHWGIIGLDTSDAIGRDDIGMVVTDARTGGVTAAGDYNNVSLFNFSEFLAEYMLCNPKTILVPEAKSSGRSITDNVSEILLKEGINPFTRIFNTVFQNPDKFRLVFEDCKHIYNVRSLYGQLKKHLGFGTTGSGDYSRDKLFGTTLTSWAQNCGSTAHDPKLIKQVLGLEIKDGRLDHGHGKHDDMVVGKLLGHWFLMNGANLDLYGINRGEVFSSVDTGEEKTDEELYSSFMTDQLRKRLTILLEVMEKEQDPMIYNRIERQVSNLYSLLKSSDNTVKLSLSEFMENIEKRRSDRF